MALQKIVKVALILLNVNQPNHHRFELRLQLKKLEMTKDTSIIFLSVLDKIMNKVKGFEVGDHFCVKLLED